MARRSHHRHLIASETVKDGHTSRRAACGVEWAVYWTDDRSKVTCPKCAESFAEEVLRKSQIENGVSLSCVRFLKDHVKHSEWRSLYVVHMGSYNDYLGEAVAFVGFPNGYGGEWEVLSTIIASNGDFTYGDSLAKRYRIRGARHAARDLAVAAIPALRKAHPELLSSRPEIEARYAAVRARVAENNRKWETRQALERERRQLIRDGLESLFSRPDLTNMERAAVAALQEDYNDESKD